MMMQKIHIYLILFSLMTVSCRSEFQKILKSNDYNTKYEAAINYFNKKDFQRSLQLFESISPVYRGTDKDETINYYIAQCNFKNDDYLSASYYFKTFINNFPNSEKQEECRYLTGYCYYMSSPKYTLDQENTKLAIEEFQIYINKYPKGVNIEQCNTYLTELRKKLEKKDFFNSKMYYDMENYKAAIVAFKNFLNTFPDTEYREDAMFLIVKSGFLMAENSIQSKQFERFESVIIDYQNYIDEYPTGKFISEAEKYYTKSQAFIKKSTL